MQEERRRPPRLLASRAPKIDNHLTNTDGVRRKFKGFRKPASPFLAGTTWIGLLFSNSNTSLGKGFKFSTLGVQKAVTPVKDSF